MAKVGSKAFQSAKSAVKAKKKSNVDVKPKVKPVEKEKVNPRSSVDIKGLTIRQLLKVSKEVGFIRNNAQDVRFEAVQRKRTKADLPGVLAKAISVGMKSRHTTYNLTVVGKLNDMKLSQKGQKVLVSCSCDFFWTHCEYALTHHGASRIKYSNGEPAVVTNPANVPIVCKHAFALMEIIMEKGW